jgi:hypothetical protein
MLYPAELWALGQKHEVIRVVDWASFLQPFYQKGNID